MGTVFVSRAIRALRLSAVSHYSQTRYLTRRQGFFLQLCEKSLNVNILQGSLSQVVCVSMLCVSILCSLRRRAHPQLASEHYDLASGLLLPESPLHQVLAVFSRQAHVPPGHRRVRRTRQDVRLGLIVRVHAVGVNDPQRAVIAHLITVPQLICRIRFD